MNRAQKLFYTALFLGTAMMLARADVLVATNGEQFVGTVIQETATNVVFDSESAGRLTFPQSKIRELQRTPPLETKNAPAAPVVTTNAPTNSVSWKPPGIGHDGADWVELKSGEWLRGELKYVQDKDVEFDSDEMDELTLKMKDVSKLYTANPVFTQFEKQQPVYGMVVISNNLVFVEGESPLSLHRDLLMGITPSGGDSGVRNWSGKASLSLSMQSGNNDQLTLTTSGELARRTPITLLKLTYLGNYSQAGSVQSADNQRANLTYDIRFSQDWFVRPIQFEYFADSLANIKYRLTGGVGAGYYVFDRPGLTWQLSAGPSFQYTRFSTVETNEPSSVSSAAAVLSSNFETDITQRMTFYQTWSSTFTDDQAGKYSHHVVSTLEFEVKRHLNLDVSLVWDYLAQPQAESDGVVPKNSDFYLTVGFGVRF